MVQRPGSFIIPVRAKSRLDLIGLQQITEKRSMGFVTHSDDEELVVDWSSLLLCACFWPLLAEMKVGVFLGRKKATANGA